MRTWMMMVLTIIFVMEDEGLIGTLWYVPTPESWAAIRKREHRDAVLRAARWEEKMRNDELARKRQEYREWLSNCEVVAQRIA